VVFDQRMHAMCDSFVLNDAIILPYCRLNNADSQVRFITCRMEVQLGGIIVIR
jgi:hypothetical protein